MAGLPRAGGTCLRGPAPARGCVRRRGLDECGAHALPAAGARGRKRGRDQAGGPWGGPSRGPGAGAVQPGQVGTRAEPAPSEDGAGVVEDGGPGGRPASAFRHARSARRWSPGAQRPAVESRGRRWQAGPSRQDAHQQPFDGAGGAAYPTAAFPPGWHASVRALPPPSTLAVLPVQDETRNGKMRHARRGEKRPERKAGRAGARRSDQPCSQNDRPFHTQGPLLGRFRR